MSLRIWWISCLNLLELRLLKRFRKIVNWLSNKIITIINYRLILSRLFVFWKAQVFIIWFSIDSILLLQFACIIRVFKFFKTLASSNRCFICYIIFNFPWKYWLRFIHRSYFRLICLLRKRSNTKRMLILLMILAKWNVSFIEINC